MAENDDKRGASEHLKRVKRRRHGLYSARAVALLPLMARAEADKFRRALERCVVDTYGEISVSQAALVHSAVENQKLALANRETLYGLVQAGPVDADLRLRFDAEYSKLLDKRDSKVKALGIEKPKPEASNPLTALYGRVVESEATEPPDST